MNAVTTNLCLAKCGRIHFPNFLIPIKRSDFGNASALLALKENVITVSLLEFARTGALAGISVGHSRAQVEAILGSPDTWEMPLSTIETADIWKYGDIEFFFFDDELSGIFTDWFDVPTGGPSMNLDPWIVRFGLPRHEFEAGLCGEGVSFTCADNRHNQGEVDLTTHAQVCFTFRESANEYGPAGLCVMQTSLSNHG